MEVVSALAVDPNFLKQLFLALESASSSDPEWVDLVAFLQVGVHGCMYAALALAVVLLDQQLILTV